jgi:hypothetical protein
LKVLETDLGFDIILQQLTPYIPIVGMFDSSPWNIAAVFGQLDIISQNPSNAAQEV